MQYGLRILRGPRRPVRELCDGSTNRSGGRPGKWSGRQLDHERRGPSECVVLPVRGGAGEPGQASKRQVRVADEPEMSCEPPCRRNARPKRSNHRLSLLEPDRDVRMNGTDQPGGEARLRLGEGTRPRILQIPRFPDRLPTRGEIASQVNAAPVQASPQGEAVRVQVRDVEDGSGRWAAVLKGWDIGPGALRAMDATEGEDPSTVAVGAPLA